MADEENEHEGSASGSASVSPGASGSASASHDSPGGVVVDEDDAPPSGTASGSGSPQAKPSSHASELWRTARRMLGTLTQVQEDGVEGSRRGRGSAVPWEKVVDEARRPFGLLLQESPTVDQLLHGTHSDSEVFRAIVRERLINRIMDCCKAVISELTRREAALWNSFVREDRELRGLILVEEEDSLRRVVAALAPSSHEVLDSWLQSLRGYATDAELDFADLLDWFANDETVRDDTTGEVWAAGVSTLRSSVAQLSKLFGSNLIEPAAPPRMDEESVAELRVRCLWIEAPRLAEAAVAYQKSMVLTACLRCERRLRSLLLPILTGDAAANGAVAGTEGPQRRVLRGLLVVLRAINDDLAPSERVLWEFLVESSNALSGTWTKDEILVALEKISSAQLKESSSSSSASSSNEDLGELLKLRRRCHQRSVDQLFDDCYEDTGSDQVTLAGVLRWFWDMPEDYRFAAGLCAPMALLQRSLRRQPEEMFAGPLRHLASQPSSSVACLLGHAHAFADLQALSTRRVVEALKSGMPTRTGTRTNSTSETCTEFDLQDDGTQGAAGVEDGGAEVFAGAEDAYAAGRDHIDCENGVEAA